MTLLSFKILSNTDIGYWELNPAKDMDYVSQLFSGIPVMVNFAASEICATGYKMAFLDFPNTQ